VLNEALQARLELVVVGAVGAPLEVKLQLQHLSAVQLTIDVPVELLGTVLAVHCCGTCVVPLERTIPDSTA
jgi:hypothetical protein